MKWLIVLAAMVASVVVWWRRHRAAGRQRKLMALCERAGLEFAPWDLAPGTAWLPFPIFGRLRSGTENVVWDRTRGQGIRVFDYWYEDPAADHTSAPKRWLTCAAVPLPGSVPRLTVSPRAAAVDAVKALGTEELRFELERFNRRFAVRSEDERFAWAFLEQRMMEGLLGLPEGVTAEVNGDTLLLTAPLLPAEKVLVLFEAAVEISQRIPRSLSSRYPQRPAEGPFEDRWLQGRWTPDPTHDPG